MSISLRFVRMVKRLAALAAVFAAAAAAASAQTAPVPTATPQPAPTPIVVPTVAPVNPILRSAEGAITQIIGGIRQHDQNTARGTVVYLKHFDMQVQTGTNSYRSVHLHQGTQIDPRGVSIVPGMTVNVSGRGGPGTTPIEADVITVEQ